MQNKTYKDLRVWQKSIDLCLQIYEATKSFPESEKFGLISQMRRAAISIPSNIAEGSKRGTDKSNKNFLHVSFGSGAELETQLVIAERLGYTKANEIASINDNLANIMKMLSGLIKHLDS